MIVEVNGVFIPLSSQSKKQSPILANGTVTMEPGGKQFTGKICGSEVSGDIEGINLYLTFEIRGTRVVLAKGSNDTYRSGKCYFPFDNNAADGILALHLPTEN